jgi:hypothetical protein
MRDSQQPKSGSSYADTSTRVKDSERRGADRVPVCATAEIVELKSNARFTARTTDLSPGGCFVDTKVPLPIGTKVRVNLLKSTSNFEASGVVVYSQYGLGMGISFEEMTPERRKALDLWLNASAKPEQTAYEPPRMVRTTGSESDRALLLRLIHLLVGKGILTEKEGDSLLFDRQPLP